MSQLMVVGDDSDDCSKVMVPVTLESPRRTATRREDHFHVSYLAGNNVKHDAEFSACRGIAKKQRRGG